jgi:hypothetical protein
MIIEMTDGRAVYYEARDPDKAEARHLHLTGDRWSELPPQPLDVVADWVRGGGSFPPQSRAELRIEGAPSWQVRIEEDSGEIPPEVADRALRAMDALASDRVGALWDLRPYLARIAGRQA